MAVPMYRLIAADLRRQIESGALKPGAQLKTEVELREDYAQNGYKKMKAMGATAAIRPVMKISPASPIGYGPCGPSARSPTPLSRRTPRAV
jgi:hypothetical protein